MAASALDISSENLRVLAGLYEEIRAESIADDAVSTDPLALSREHVRRTKRLLIDVQKIRRGPRTAAVHRDSHARRMELEKVWAEKLNRLSVHLVAQFDIDSAILAAHRAWITPAAEPQSGIYVDDSVVKSRFALVRKKLSPAKPEDIEAISDWQGERGVSARAALKKAEAQGTPAYVMRNADGDPIGVATVDVTGDSFHVSFLATTPGNGTKMMRELAQVAGRQGKGISLVSIPDAKNFLTSLGMTPGAHGAIGWTPAQVSAFAKTAGILAPPGARNPGLTQKEDAAAQQLALSALQGVPAGQRGGVEDVKRALTNTVNEASWLQGGATEYLGLAVQTAEQAGQVSLDHLGLDKTFAFASPQNMAQDTFAARGSKVVQQMYGNHVDKLTKIITDATDPRNPKTISEVKASIREQWPALQSYQVDRIARTETAAVWTTTAANAYAANGISEFETIVASGPSIGIESEDPCDECVDMASDTHSIDDDLPPWHPNCRCEAIPVLEDEDGTPWLPPDEPWTGGADGAEPVEGYEPRDPSLPGEQPDQYAEAAMQDLDPALAEEAPIPEEYQQTIDQLGLDRLPKDMPKGAAGDALYGSAADTRELWQDGWSTTPDGEFIPGTWKPEREALHEDIYDAHYAGKTLPPAGQTPQAFFTAGGGASGKGASTFMVNIGGTPTEMTLKEIEKRNDFIIVDPDRIKKMMPEYKALIAAGKIVPADGLYAAAGVHEESSDLAKLIAEDAMSRGYNVVFDTTGSSPKFLQKIIKAKEHGYETQVTMMSVPTNDAVVRSIDRAERAGSSSEGRYVSVKALREAHAGASQMMPLWQKSGAVDSWRVFDNSDFQATVVAESSAEKGVVVHDRETYNKVRAKALQDVEEEHVEAFPIKDYHTPEGWQEMLARHEGETMRVRFTTGQSYTGPVSRYSNGKMLIARRMIRDVNVPKVLSVEIKVGGRFKPLSEVEGMSEEERAVAAKPRNAKEYPAAPEGGYVFPKNAPTGRIGDVPPTPIFESPAHAKAFAEKYIVRTVDLGNNPDLKGVQQALDGMAKVLRPFDLKIDSFEVGNLKSKVKGTLAQFGMHTAADGEKFTSLKAHAKDINARAAEKMTTETQRVFDNNIMVHLSRNADAAEAAVTAGDSAKITAAYERDQVLKATKRWFVASVEPAQAVEMLMAHEAGHALDHMYGELRNKFAAKLEEHGMTQADKYAVSEYGGVGSSRDTTKVGELWAEVTAAKVSGHFDIVPLSIQRAYDETLATITPEDIAAIGDKVVEREAKRSAADNRTLRQRAEDARLAQLRKRVGLT